MSMESFPAKAAGLVRYIRRPADDLPVMQMTVPSHDGNPPHVVTLAPGDRLAFFTGALIESCRVHAINKQEIEQLAAIIPTDMTPQFEFDINDTVIGYACLLTHGFLSPHFFRELFDALQANPEATITKYAGIPFVEVMFAHIHQEAMQNLSSPFDDKQRQFRMVARAFRDQMRQMIRSGRERDVSGLFFEHVTRMARRLGSDLKLPARDPSRGGPGTTPFFQFAQAMHRLLIEQCRSLGVSPTNRRFARVEQMEPTGVIIALESAKAAATAKNPVMSMSP